MRRDTIITYRQLRRMPLDAKSSMCYVWGVRPEDSVGKLLINHRQTSCLHRQHTLSVTQLSTVYCPVLYIVQVQSILINKSIEQASQRLSDVTTIAVTVKSEVNYQSLGGAMYAVR